ncbi:unnamed protein product [Caenorhabditis sp. 36 PRJEB53466]|nr:unnamed protein product [Caenorhabditis sp. 36 PRJEB53466]
MWGPPGETERECEKFAKQYAHKLTKSRFLTREHLSNENYLYHMTTRHLWTRIQEVRSVPKIHNANMLFHSLDVIPDHGAQYSCANVADIQKVFLNTSSDSDDEENDGNKLPEQLAFPELLMNTLRDLFLQSYLLDDVCLEDAEYVPGEHDSMRCISYYKGTRSREEVFKMYGAARESFLQYTFRYQLRKALCDMRNAKFVPGDATRGTSDTFKPRKHSAKSRKRRYSNCKNDNASTSSQ